MLCKRRRSGWSQGLRTETALASPGRAGRAGEGSGAIPAPEHKGNAEQANTRRTQRCGSVSQRAEAAQASPEGLDLAAEGLGAIQATKLERVRKIARLRKKEMFTALLHHVSVDLLREAFLALKRRAAPGVDGVTWQDYEAELESHLQVLHQQVHRGSYRAQPVKRRFIPKADGKLRPLG